MRMVCVVFCAADTYVCVFLGCFVLGECKGIHNSGLRADFGAAIKTCDDLEETDNTRLSHFFPHLCC